MGGGLVFALGYGYYHTSGAKTLVNAATNTKKQFDSLTKGLSDKAPEPSELLKWFRTTATSYAAFVPGAKSYVDKAFDDLDKVEAKHRGEVEEIIKTTYNELHQSTKSGLSMETASRAYAALEKAMKKIGELAVDSAGDLMDNHPDLKEKFGGNLDKLKNMADQYGPDAKKELDHTYTQIKEVIGGGIGVGTIAKVKAIIDEKMQKVSKLGDEAWKKGMEAAQPALEKNPKMKELLEKNADALKSGNLSELWDKVKSGNMEDMEKYVKDAAGKAKSQGLGSFGSLGKEAEKYLKMIPGAGEIVPKLMKLQEIGQKHGKEAENLLKETYDEVAKILEKKTQEAEKLGEKAKDNAEKEAKK